MPAKTAPQLYEAKSQSWVGNVLIKPVRMGGRPVEEGDPIVTSHPHLFEPYVPDVRDYAGRGTQDEKRSA